MKKWILYVALIGVIIYDFLILNLIFDWNIDQTVITIIAEIGNIAVGLVSIVVLIKSIQQKKTIRGIIFGVLFFAWGLMMISSLDAVSVNIPTTWYFVFDLAVINFFLMLYSTRKEISVMK